METCAICYESRPPIKFFYLSCCGNNKLCSYCLEKLVCPKCPYCRKTIEGFNNQKQKQRPQEETTWAIRQRDFTSRIERRQLKRLIKLELHENDRERNRRLRSFSV